MGYDPTQISYVYNYDFPLEYLVSFLIN
jgi:hypothetical protein